MLSWRHLYQPYDGLNTAPCILSWHLRRYQRFLLSYLFLYNTFIVQSICMINTYYNSWHVYVHSQTLATIWQVRPLRTHLYVYTWICLHINTGFFFFLHIFAHCIIKLIKIKFLGDLNCVSKNWLKHKHRSERNSKKFRRNRLLNVASMCSDKFFQGSTSAKVHKEKNLTSVSRFLHGI